MIQDQSPRKCFTIGYGDYPIDRFTSMVNSVGIDTIVDVRSTPFSRFNPDFNRTDLEKSLKSSHIDYLFMGDKIGGRYTDPGLLFPDSTVNYRAVQTTTLFQDGIHQLLSILSSGKTIALMCAEKEPERCHRFVLISRELQARGVPVFHVRPDMSLQANEDLEKELIGTLVDTRQRTISGEPLDYADLMYEKLNRKVGFRLKDSHEMNRE